MIKELEKRNALFINKILIFGCIFIFIIGALFHFLYHISGNNQIAAVFFPVNESIFEHLKLALYPTIIYWLIAYLILHRDYKLYLSKWIVSMTFSIAVSIIFIVAYYYVFNYAFNISLTILDILSLLAGSFLGQILGCHIYNRSKGSTIFSVICILILLLTCISFANFTFYPPNLPLFIDPSTGQLGI